MATACEKEAALDPRIRRTRELLSTALWRLLEEGREFNLISVQDITEAATVNRATFYAHYPDKFALLENMVAGRFAHMLHERKVEFDGTCAGALRGFALAVCDYLAAQPRLDCQRQIQLEPHMEAAIIGVVRDFILHGLQQHPPANQVSPAMMATTVSWAIYGAAKEWTRQTERGSSDEIADVIVALVAPIMHAPARFTEPLAAPVLA